MWILRFCSDQVMLAWAKSEFEKDNVGNARILLAEALRRSPEVQPLYVLAGNVELVAGNLGETKRSENLRALG